MADLGDGAIEAARIEARERQYTGYVTWTERLVDRRAEANRFYVTLDLAIVGAIGLLFSDRFDGVAGTIPVEWIALAFAFAGLVVSYNWRSVIASQRKLMSSKFEIIHLLEEKLPSKPYAEEWGLTAPGRKKVSTAHFEGRLPWLFMIFFLAILVAAGAQAFGVDVAGALRALAAPPR